MKTIQYNGKAAKLSKMLATSMPELSYSYMQKLLRKGDIRQNGKKIYNDETINDSDVITVYAKDELLQKFHSEIVYDDENITIFNKQTGICSEGENSFENLIKNEFGNNYTLCHRLDTNTTGLLIFAKNKTVFEEVKQAFIAHKIEKYYYAAVYGEVKKPMSLKGFLIKDSSIGKVKIFDKYENGSAEIITEVKPMEIFGDYTVIEVKLVTGKTHQIRAHLAYAGFPVIGDSKYGSEQINRKFSKRKQLLVAYKLCFNIDSGILKYLNGKAVKLEINCKTFFNI